MSSVLVKVSLQTFANALATARSVSPRIAQNCLPSAVVSTKIANAFWAQHRPSKSGLAHYEALAKFHAQHCKIYLAYAPGQVVTGGFVVLDGELLGFWGPGLGEWLLRQALSVGADRLDCFDGFLTGFYAKWGFREVLREPNYAAKGPDVVWMRLA